MAVKAGETARATGDFICEECGKAVHVDRGREIPKCPDCGNGSYVARENEPQYEQRKAS